MDYNKFYNMIMDDIEYWDKKTKDIKGSLSEANDYNTAISSTKKILENNKRNLIKVWSGMDSKVFQNIVDQYCNNVLFLGLHMPYVITQAMGDGVINEQSTE